MPGRLRKIIRYIYFRLSTIATGKHLKNKKFTIVANDCWGGQVYQSMYLPYQSPFVGVFLNDIDYLRLLKNFSWYMSQKLMFIEISRYGYINQMREKSSHKFPIGILGGDVEIYFLHYKDEKEVSEKWERRINRICWENIFFVLKTNSRKNILTFHVLPHKKKICFTNQEGINSYAVVYIPIPDHLFYRGPILSHGYFDVVNWLNGGDWRVKFSIRKLCVKFCYICKYIPQVFNRVIKNFL